MTKEIIRMFVAVDLPDQIKAGLEKLIENISQNIDGVRWTQPEGMHLTLKFLGEVEVERVGKISEAVAASTGKFGPLDISFRGVGAFPNLRKPRVLWVGVNDNPQLIKIAGALDRGMARVGFKPETKRYTAHLTLGRIKRRTTGYRDLEKYDETKFGSFVAEKINLFQSDLQPGGAVYTKLETFDLVKRRK